jgi:hypothetical protein
MATKRKIAALAPEDEDPIDPADELMFLCLGGGNEVGRSCHILQYKGKTVMVRGRGSQAEEHVLTRCSLTLACIRPTRACLQCPSTTNSISAP